MKSLGRVFRRSVLYALGLSLAMACQPVDFDDSHQSEKSQSRADATPGLSDEKKDAPRSDSSNSGSKKPVPPPPVTKAETTPIAQPEKQPSLPSVANQPVVVGGLHLQMKCAQEILPSPEFAGTLLGCRIEDERGVRMPLGEVGESYDLGWIDSEDEGYFGARKRLLGDARYDVVFFFQASTLDDLKQALETIEIVLVETTTNAQYARDLPKILVEASSFVESSDADFSSLRSELAFSIAQGGSSSNRGGYNGGGNGSGGSGGGR